MNKELREYIGKLRRIELKSMHSYDINDECFGCETYLYFLITQLLDNRISIKEFISKIESEYKNDAHYISIISEINKLL